MRLIFASQDQVAEAAGRRIVAAAREALARRNRFRLALPGGRTPVATFAWLAREQRSGGAAPALDPARTEIWFADERAVSPDDPESNYGLARETLIAPLGIPAENVFRMKAELPDLAAAALDYEARLDGPLDLVLLGIGEDGHIASLFPGSAAIAEKTRRVVAVLDSPKPPPRRLTLAPRALDEAREILVLATGAGKADAVARALDRAGPVSEVPARLVRERVWLLDAPAAAKLAG